MADESLFKDSPSTDDQHSDGEEGSGMCWFASRGRWRFTRLEGKQSKWRVSPLTRSQSAVGRDVEGCCCCSPRWRRTSKCVDGDGDGTAARGASAKGNLWQKFAWFNDSSSPRFVGGGGGGVSPALSPLPVRPLSKVERDKEREAFVPIWQRRATMSPIKALDLRHRTS